jgi:hypothetical protein
MHKMLTNIGAGYSRDRAISTQTFLNTKTLDWAIKVVYLENNKPAKLGNSILHSILLLVFLICASMSVAGLTSSDIQGVPQTFPPAPESACELHVGFNYRLPAAKDPAQWTLSDLVASTTAVEDFLKRLNDLYMKDGKEKTVYVRGFSSYEGIASVNKQIAERRAMALAKIVDQLVSTKGYRGINAISYSGYTSKTDIFWQLTSAEKKAIDDYYRRSSTEAQRDAIFASVPALMENRRAILSWGYNDYSKVNLNGQSQFLDNACKAPAQIPSCPNGKLDPGEECEPNTQYDCASKGPGFKCVECKCISSGVPLTCGNNIKDANEECDGKDDKACPGNCTSTCKCGTKPGCMCPLAPLYSLFGFNICDQNEILALILCWFWIIPLILWVYRVRRTHSKKREDPAGTAIDTKNSAAICMFLARIIETKKQLIESVRRLEEKIAATNEKERQQFAEYLKNFRDVAYLRDRTSPEYQMLEKSGENVKELFEDYLALIADLLDLEHLEATLLDLIDKLKQGCVEIRVKGKSVSLEEMKILLTPQEAEKLEREILPKLKAESELILSEIDKIEITVEEHVREMGITLTGIISLIGHNKWKSRFIKEYEKKYKEDGEAAFKQLWWAKHNYKFRAPIMMRSGDMPLRTPERHHWPFRTEKHRAIYKYLPFGKWKEDEVITTQEGSDKEKAWKEKVKALWNRDITARSAYLKKLGADMTSNIDRDMHILSNLFRIVAVDNEKQVIGIEKTGELKGANEQALLEKKLKYDGSLKGELDALVLLTEIICEQRKPFSVKIESPRNMTITREEMNGLLAKKDAFVAKLSGGKPVYRHIWFWGPAEWDILKYPEQQAKELLALSDPLLVYGPGATDATQIKRMRMPFRATYDVKYDYGFFGLNRQAEVASKTTYREKIMGPFNEMYSVDGKRKMYVLRILAIDANDQVAHDHIIIEVKTQNVIMGRVVEHKDPSKGVEGADVYIRHSEFPDGSVEIEYSENGKRVTVKSGKDGKFAIKGSFTYNIKVHAEKGNATGYHMLKLNSHDPPKEPITFTPETHGMVKDVVVPIISAKGKSPPKIVYPTPPYDLIEKNISKIQDIVNGKAGAGSGIKNNMPQAIQTMRQEILTHLNEINQFRKTKNYLTDDRKEMYKLLCKASSPSGLNNYKEGRFFGWIDINDMHQKGFQAPLRITTIEKFVFGSPRPLAIGYTGEGSSGKIGEGSGEDYLKQSNFAFQTKGIGAGAFMTSLFAGNIDAINQLVLIIEEKKKLFTEYLLKVKEFEDKIYELAVNEHDPEMAKIYDKVRMCFTDIRQFLEKHGTLNNLSGVELELKKMMDFTGRSPITMDDKSFVEEMNIRDPKDLDNYIKKHAGSRIKSHNTHIDKMICQIYGWKVTTGESWEQETRALEGEFNSVVEETIVWVNTLTEELKHSMEMMEENYKMLAGDLQALNEYWEAKNKKELKEIGAYWAA